MIITSDSLKRRAKEALKPDLNTAVMITFVALLPSLLSQTAVTIAARPLQDVQQEWYVMLSNTGMLPETSVMLRQMVQVMGKTQLLLLGAALLFSLVQPFLEIGWLSCLLRYLRGEAPKLSDILCRRDCLVKAIGLYILRFLKMLLWMLPGWAGYFICMLPVILWRSTALLFFAPVCMSVSVVMGIRAALHYSMASYVMADRPELSIRACIRESVRIMRYRKMIYVLLLISFIGWMLLLTIVSNLATGVSVVIGLTMQMLLSVPLNLYRSATVCVFYNVFKQLPSAPQAGFEAMSPMGQPTDAPVVDDDADDEPDELN